MGFGIAVTSPYIPSIYIYIPFKRDLIFEYMDPLGEGSCFALAAAKPRTRRRRADAGTSDSRGHGGL